MIEQNTDAWRYQRGGKITGSRFADVLAKPDTAAYRNYLLQVATERLTGEWQGPNYQSAEMIWGTEQEPFAKARYEAVTGDLITACGYIAHPDHWFAGASPDGLLGQDGCIETKCPKSTTHVEYLRDRKLPAKYRPQVQGQMWCAGKTFAHFVSYDPRMPEHLQLLIVPVERDDVYIAKLQTAVLEFNAEVESLLSQLKGI